MQGHNWWDYRSLCFIVGALLGAQVTLVGVLAVEVFL